MSTMMMSVLATVGFFGLPPNDESAGTMKQSDCREMKSKDCCTWSMVTVGKHLERRWKCVETSKPPMPEKVRVEVKPEDRQPGDDWGYKTVGKHVEKAYYRMVDAPKETQSTDCSKVASKGDCNYGMFTVGKNLVRKSLCRQNGDLMMCGEKPGECAVCLR